MKPNINELWKANTLKGLGQTDRWMLLNSSQIFSPLPPLPPLPFDIFCALLPLNRGHLEFSVRLIHWEDSSHVISTFNLTNEDSWLELIAFPQGHNSICDVHHQSPSTLEYHGWTWGAVQGLGGGRRGWVEAVATSIYARWGPAVNKHMTEPFAPARHSTTKAKATAGGDSSASRSPPYG